MSLLSKELVYALILMLGAMNFGWILGYPSPAIPDIRDKYMPNITDSQSQIFNAISSLFAISGPFLSNTLLGFMGRRPATFVIGFLSFVFWILQTTFTPETFWVAIVVRSILGSLMGACSSLIPLYIVEIAPPQYSGFFGSLNQLGIAFGIFMCFLLGTWYGWKTLCYIAAAQCVLLCILVWLVPETSSNSSEKEESSPTESICQAEHLPSLFIGMLLMFFQQFSGVNAILTNLTDLFVAAHVEIKSGIASAIAASAQVISVFIGGSLMDKLGRKKIWIISLSGISGSLLLYSLTMKITMSSWIPIISVFAFLLFFGLGAGPIPWFIVPELFPSSLRAKASSITASTNWLCAFSVIFLFKAMVKSLTQFGSFIVFMIIAAAGSIFGVLYIQNPKNEYQPIEHADSMN